MTVKTAARTLDLFEAFARTQEPLTLSELASALNMPVSSCFALVRTLESRGYVYMVAARKSLYPTKRLLDVAHRIAENDPILERVTPFLERLRDATGETIAFSNRRGDHIVYLDVFESSNSVRYHAQVGDAKFLHSSSVGKAFLGAMADDDLRKLVSRMKLTRLTSATLTSRKALLDDIARSRKRGWYCNVKESVEDLGGVAVTVSMGGERYGISIAGPVYRMQANLEAHAKKLLKTQQAIEAGH